MKVVISGDRSLDSELFLFPILDAMLEEFCNPADLFGTIRDVTGFVTGGCRGVDEVGERWARKHGFPVDCEPPDYRQYKDEATFVRNQKMANQSMGAFVIYTPWSRGSRDMIRRAKRGRLILLTRQIRPAPCTSCGRSIASLVENMDGNGGRPWPTCLSCGRRP